MCRVVAHRRAGRRGNRNSASNAMPSIRRICIASAISANISAGRGKSFRRPRLRASAISTTLFLRQPLGEARKQGDHTQEQRPDYRIHHPRDAVPDAVRLDLKTQFFPHED